MTKIFLQIFLKLMLLHYWQILQLVVEIWVILINSLINSFILD